MILIHVSAARSEPRIHLMASRQSNEIFDVQHHYELTATFVCQYHYELTATFLWQLQLLRSLNSICQWQRIGCITTVKIAVIVYV